MPFYCHDDRVEMCWIAVGRSNISNNYQWNSNVYQFNRILVFPMVAGVYVSIHMNFIFFSNQEFFYLILFLSFSHSLSHSSHSFSHPLYHLHSAIPNRTKHSKNVRMAHDNLTIIHKLYACHFYIHSVFRWQQMNDGISAVKYLNVKFHNGNISECNMLGWLELFVFVPPEQNMTQRWR